MAEPLRSGVALRCGGNRYYGTAVGATGEIEVWCTAKWCRRPGMQTRHIFNLATGVCVDQHVPEQSRPDREGARRP